MIKDAEAGEVVLYNKYNTMTTINENFLKLQKNYLFADIAQKVAAYKKAHPEAKIIRLGIGDVTRPLAPAVIKALH